jgi:phosphoribosylformylglycinamidine synthase
VDTVHDCSDGGLAVALAEMAMAGGIGAGIGEVEPGIPLHAFLFGEDQARYVLAVEPDRVPDILYAASAGGIPVALLGVTGGGSLHLPGEPAIPLGDLREAHEGWMPRYMAG